MVPVGKTAVFAGKCPTCLSLACGAKLCGGVCVTGNSAVLPEVLYTRIHCTTSFFLHIVNCARCGSCCAMKKQCAAMHGEPPVARATVAICCSERRMSDCGKGGGCVWDGHWC